MGRCFKLLGKAKKEQKAVDCTGSAFFVAEHYLLTCKHIVSALFPGDKLSVCYGNNKYSAELMDTAEDWDLALLYTETSAEEDWIFLLDRFATEGREAIAYGYPHGGVLDEQRGMVIGTELDNGVANLTFANGVTIGFSGGPVCPASDKGTAVGVIITIKVRDTFGRRVETVGFVSVRVALELWGEKYSLCEKRYEERADAYGSNSFVQPMTNTHKTEEEKRVWDRKEIRAINRDLIQWAITSPLYEMAVGDKDPDQILLSKALGQNESNRYEGSFALMQSIWNRYPELGMAPDYKFLSTKEYSGQYYAGYRDHTTHMFKVFLLGLFLYEKSEKIRSSIIEKIPSQQDFLSVWILTSLYHDVGYVIETEDGCWDSDAGMDVVKRLNDYLAHPFSYLYSDIMDIGTEEALQTKYNLTVAEFCGHYDIQQKLRYFKGIGPLVKLSLEEDANPVQGYYEYASSKRNGRQFFDHGIVGACMLLYSCEAVCDYMQGIKDKSVSIYPNQREKLYCFLAFSEKYKEFTKIAAQAIALHNIQKNWNETEIKDLNLLYGVTINSFCIPQKELPIAYLLRICDELQCWDRQSFISPLGNTRMPLEQDKLCFLPRPSEVDLSVKNEKKREELEKALREVLEPPLYTIMELKD